MQDIIHFQHSAWIETKTQATLSFFLTIIFNNFFMIMFLLMPQNNINFIWKIYKKFWLWMFPI